MDLAAKIDPAEVLAHLNQLGYRDITPLQLKEFTLDLKKLIIYDQLSSSFGSTISPSTLSHTSEYQSVSELSSDASIVQSGGPTVPKQYLFRTNENSRENSDRISRSQHECKTSTTSFSSGVLKRQPSHASLSTGKNILTENVLDRRGKDKQTSEEDLQQALKPKTSFIRPWQLQSVSSRQGRAERSDPVKLYHYYQTLWAQRKCPGEDSHADLRWVIREKMLGQDPHLYPQNVIITSKKRNGLRL